MSCLCSLSSLTCSPKAVERVLRSREGPGTGVECGFSGSCAKWVVVPGWSEPRAGLLRVRLDSRSSGHSLLVGKTSGEAGCE